MAVIDMVKWDASDNLFAWKYPSQELSTWTQLIVAESQEAVLVREGIMEGPFGPGRHTLETKNIPLLTELLKLPFGGKTPFTAEVWFVNRVIPLDVKWGTAEPVQVQDPKYNVMIPVRANGQFGIQVAETKKFLIKLMGTMKSFDRRQLSSYFRGIMLMNVKDAIATSLVKEKIPVLEISAYLKEVSGKLEEEMRPQIEEFGFDLINFFVNSISVPADDPAVVQLKAALAKRAEMDIIGYNYTQERSFDTMEKAAANEGSASAGMMGAGMGLGMGVGVGGAMGGAMGGIANNIDTSGGDMGGAMVGAIVPGATGRVKSITCDKCGHAVAKGSKFCPNCGDSFRCCPRCDADNADDALQCTSCGEAFPKPCPDCGEALSPGAKFCPNCGKSMVAAAKKCSKCQAELKAGSKFCAECGTPVKNEGE